MNIEVPFFAHIHMLTRYLRLPIFTHTRNVLDLQLQGQTFE